MCRLAAIFQGFSIAVLWPLMMGLTGSTSYVAIVYSSTINKVCRLSYASSVMVAAVNIAGSTLVKITVELEGWAPRTAIKATALSL